MKIPFVDLNAQYQTIKPEIDAVIADVIDRSAFVRGPYVEQFEIDFANATGAKHCLSCANGTDALYVAMKALGVKPGDEVITTAHSWISTSETITQAGARVVFCDTDDQTFTIDPRGIEDQITDRTVGIIPVHLFGQPADMDPILEIAQEKGLWVIEDCAQAHLAEYKGRQVGTMGDVGTFSFYPGKNLGAMGDAGGIITDNKELFDWMSLFARHGGKGDHQIEGINSRMDGMQAGILSVKLKYLESWIEKRNNVARLYDRALGQIQALRIPETAKDRTHAYHLYVIRSPRRDELREYLSENGIPTVLNYPKALPFFKAYEYLGHEATDFPVAYRHQNEILSLPIFPEMSDDQIGYVISHIQKFHTE